MSDYNFQSLNATDFEHLVRDLLNQKFKAEKTGIQLRSYTAGKDLGIDLLDNQSNFPPYKMVVQVKHNLNTPYSTFLSQLTNTTNLKSEIHKIKKLNTQRYLLVTSRTLTRSNQEEIFKELQPYVKSVDDIIDQVEVNRLIAQFPSVVDQHPKLWFSSKTILDRIFHNAVYATSSHIADEIKAKIPLYVPIYSEKEALNTLRRQKLLVLTGDPGCGKTTFAEMLIFRLLAEEFEFFWIGQSTSEVASLVKTDDSKQLFYFDDFLGHTKFEIERGKSEEKGLLVFLRRILSGTNKLFILTTRNSLITAAAAESDRFKKSDLFTRKNELKFSGISSEYRKQIVENHLAVKEVPESYSKFIRSKDAMDTIVRHDNFSPRLIEFVTTSNNYCRIKPEGYLTYVIQTLNYPQEVWRYAYEHQIDDYDRFLLTTLFSFGSATTLEFLETAYFERLNYEASHNHIPIPNNSFNLSFQKLLGSFLTFKWFYKREKVDFINPSLEDFLQHYLRENTMEAHKIINSVAFIEQVISRFRRNRSSLISLQPTALFRFQLRQADISTISDLPGQQKENYRSLYLAFISWMCFHDKESEVYVCQKLKQVDWSIIIELNYYHLFGFIDNVSSNGRISKIIKQSFYQIIIYLMANLTEVSALQSVKSLFEEYDIPYSKFISNPKHFITVKQTIQNLYDDDMINSVDDLKDHTLDIEPVWEERDDFFDQIKEQFELMEIDDEPDMQIFDDVDWDIVIRKNIFDDKWQEDEREQERLRDRDDPDNDL